MKKILLFGSDGQVGRELQNTLVSSGDVIPLNRSVIDLTEADRIHQLILESQPEIIVNAAAYTAVDKAETEPELAMHVNAIATEIIAEASKKIDAFLIHISTDYVFDGQGSVPYQETDITHPLSVYGKSKLAGEESIASILDNYLILRTAWVYGKYGKGNFVKTMLRLGGEKTEISVVADQIGSPTWARDIAEVIGKTIPHLTSQNTGIYHYTNSGVASWYDFAMAIFEEAENLGLPLKVERVFPITTSEYPTPARRPAYSVLASGKLKKLLGSYPPHWRQSLRKMLKEFLL
ncbi:dTDP-4-dehydrorhamnose reductase [Calothrix sp. 336/3]|uniref:dTDP-4-dehydrorhamnose reductase n=1 Tax=Calothrix sp. 336/3 TaxID=1337936 RepID=UPI0004E399FC|nr:dTDP-4-dehydrorhamnose reductase [Calothrix sp. 336/3]AKG22259.1 dTDP-4-dehydrorhamnose reductase [Calothrix sp. 336/3]